MNAKTYKFCGKVGPGGFRCPCCTRFNSPSGEKRRMNRKFRRTAKKAAQEV